MCTQNTTISIVSPETHYAAAAVVVLPCIVVVFAYHCLFKSIHQEVNNILILYMEIYVYGINLMGSLLSINIEQEA